MWRIVAAIAGAMAAIAVLAAWVLFAPSRAHSMPPTTAWPTIAGQAGRALPAGSFHTGDDSRADDGRRGGLPVQAGGCGDRKGMLAMLAQSYGQRPTGERGLAFGGAVVEAVVAEDGSFTLLLTRPTGISCIMLMGENWEGRRPAPPGREG